MIDGGSDCSYSVTSQQEMCSLAHLQRPIWYTLAPPLHLLSCNDAPFQTPHATITITLAIRRHVSQTPSAFCTGVRGGVVWTPFRSPSPVRCLKVSRGAGAAGGWQARPAWVKQRQQPSPGRLSAASQHMALWQPPRGYTRRLGRSTLRVAH